MVQLLCRETRELERDRETEKLEIPVKLN
uniref:Uncharacterized protein n=1 Tax=Rhizophora mucronata TaxID=61149 RepID=A0A2P2MIV3_RHIMU